MPPVIIRKADYHDRGHKDTVFEILRTILIGHSLSNMHVIVKPNLLTGAPPEKAITTHPLIVKSVCNYLLDHSARITISDSPGVGNFHRIIQQCGLAESLKGLPITFKEFLRSREITAGPPFHRIELATDALDADLIVNLPKLKTHAQMLLTLGVKNFFGCVVGMKKPQWHFRAGVDRERFASVLLEIYRALQPSVTLLDGILAMEGQGPGMRGTPRHMGVIMGSTDAVALDHTVALMLGIDPLQSPVNKVAHDMGLLDEIVLDGLLEPVSDYALPELADLIFGPPSLHSFFRKHLTQRPFEDRVICKMCRECLTHCPVHAIHEKKERLHFEYDRCIRCYCCVELCPHGAMKTAQPVLGRLLYRLRK